MNTILFMGHTSFFPSFEFQVLLFANLMSETFFSLPFFPPFIPPHSPCATSTPQVEFLFFPSFFRKVFLRFYVFFFQLNLLPHYLILFKVRASCQILVHLVGGDRKAIEKKITQQASQGRKVVQQKCLSYPSWSFISCNILIHEGSSGKFHKGCLLRSYSRNFPSVFSTSCHISLSFFAMQR